MARNDTRSADALNDSWDARVTGKPLHSAGVAADLAATVEHIHMLAVMPAPDPDFADRLRRELVERARELTQADDRRFVGRRARPWRLLGPARLHWRWAGLAAALLAVALVGIYILGTRSQTVNAAEILQKAQAVASSVGASGVRSFVMVDRMSRPSNPELNAKYGFPSDMQIETETRRWYEAPDRWRVEQATTVINGGQGAPVQTGRLTVVSDGTDLWSFSEAENKATVTSASSMPTGSAIISPFGQTASDLNTMLQQASRLYTPKLRRSETVAGRRAYVIDLEQPKYVGNVVPELNGRRTIWVDQETFFVLKSVQYNGVDGTVLYTSEATSVQYNVPVAPALFTFTPPPGAMVYDNRPRPTPDAVDLPRQLAQLAEQVDFPLFVTRYLPWGLVTRPPWLDPQPGVQFAFVAEDEADLDSPAGRRGVSIREQEATANLIARLTDGAEPVTIGDDQAWLRRGYRDSRGAGQESAVFVEREGTLISVSSFAVPAEELIKVAVSLEALSIAHLPSSGSGAASESSPGLTILRPTWLPEPMAVREEYHLIPSGSGSTVAMEFNPRPYDHGTHVWLRLSEVPEGLGVAAVSSPQATHQTIGGRDVTVSREGESCVTLTWVQDGMALGLTNAFGQHGGYQYSCAQLWEIIASIR